jgi:hypothetical protein
MKNFNELRKVQMDALKDTERVWAVDIANIKEGNYGKAW